MYLITLLLLEGGELSWIATELLWFCIVVAIATWYYAWSASKERVRIVLNVELPLVGTQKCSLEENSFPNVQSIGNQYNWSLPRLISRAYMI